MSLTPGQSLSFYEVLSPLGAGGMGEVYLARDTRLDRQVAIKVLPEAFADDDERLGRFEREAKSLASLNHPNIGGIYGVDQEGDACFLVLELVPGEDLAERLARGALQLDEAFDVCRQIAEGLEGAHEAGVIHRDLKPANIRVTPQGVVKLLDFGLAKPAQVGPGSHGGAGADSDSVLVTEEGMILGTPTYMSPEQARGKPVDRRTDIWAFGCVLYECLSGKRAFAGETFTDVVAAIARSEPELAALPDLPPRIGELLRRCLAKDPRERLRDVGEARILLSSDVLLVAPNAGERPVGSPDLAAASAAKFGFRSSAGRLAAGALAGFAAGAALIWGLHPGDGATDTVASAKTPTVKLAIPSSTSRYKTLEWPILSPDGKSVLFNAQSEETGDWAFWIRALDSFEAERIPELDRASNVFWSADSKSIGHSIRGQMHVLPLVNRVPRSLPVPRFRSATWSGAGSIVYNEPDGPLWVVPAAGGEPEALTHLDESAGEAWHDAPTFLRDGDRFLFLAVVRSETGGEGQHRLYGGKLSSRDVRFIGDFPSKPWWTERDELVYAHDGWVRSVPFDSEELRINGDPVTLADGVNCSGASGTADLTVSRSGDCVFLGEPVRDEIVWVDRSGFEVEKVVGPGSYGLGFRLSPDYRSVAICTSDPRSGKTDIWIHGLDRGTRLNLTRGYSAWAGFPRWTPDGQTVFFASDSRGYPDIVSIPLNTPGQATVAWSVKDSQMPIDFIPGTTNLLAAARVGGLWSIASEGEAEPTHVESLVPDGHLSIRYSPDGKYIAYASGSSGEPQVYVRELAEGGRTVQVSVTGGEYPEWGPEGDRLFYLRGGHELWEAELSDPESMSSPSPELLFQSLRLMERFQPSADAQRFLVYFRSAPIMGASVFIRGANGRDRGVK